MIAMKVRNPQAKLVKDVQHFSEDPKNRARRVVAIGRQEGYEFIKAASQGLLEMAMESGNREDFKYAALLSQPEWKFYVTSDPNALAVTVDCAGDLTVIGYYSTGGTESGSVELSTNFTGINLLELSKDPRLAFTSTRIKQKVWRKNRKYYVIECAKDIADLETFYATDRIQKTRKPGYLWRYSGYVITDGPFGSKEEAHEARIKVIKES